VKHCMPSIAHVCSVPHMPAVVACSLPNPAARLLGCCAGTGHPHPGSVRHCVCGLLAGLHKHLCDLLTGRICACFAAIVMSIVGFLVLGGTRVPACKQLLAGRHAASPACGGWALSLDAAVGCTFRHSLQQPSTAAAVCRTTVTTIQVQKQQGQRVSACCELLIVFVVAWNGIRAPGFALSGAAVPCLLHRIVHLRVVTWQHAWQLFQAACTTLRLLTCCVCVCVCVSGAPVCRSFFLRLL